MELYDFDQDKTLENELVHPSLNFDDTFKQKAYKWCKNFLWDYWRNARFEDFEIEPIEGGLTNYLYVCSLSNSTNSKVLLRIYGEIVSHLTKFNEGIIFNVLSERKIGPKLLGAFPAGRLEEFIHTETLKFEDLIADEYLIKLAEITAAFHTIDMPLNKDPTIYLKTIYTWYAFYKKNIDGCCQQNGTDKTKIMIQKFKKFDLETQIQWLFKEIEKLNSPVVFCHNDLQEGNIMKTSDDLDTGVRLIDFEYSCYHYRGYDVGNLFCEMLFKNVDPSKEVGFSFSYDSYPCYETRMKFAKAYLNKIERVTSDMEEECRNYYLTSPERLLEEAQMLSLASHLYWGLWGFVQFKISKIKYGFMEYSLARLEGFYHFKKEFGFE